MITLLLSLLEKTAWPMTPPSAYFPFYLCLSALGIMGSGFLAWRLREISSRSRLRLFFLTGVMLALTECYKQLFLTLIVNHGCYDWWYFPFQLCSLPMYFCLLLPFISHSRQQVLYNFMYIYNLPGAVLVFVWPDGLMHPYWTLTLHSFLWHILLLFLGLLSAFSGAALSSDSTRSDGISSRSIRSGGIFRKTTALFLACCAIATLINVSARPRGSADMFYISPYFPTPQPFFSQIAARFGTGIGNLAYLSAIILNAWMMQKLLPAFFKKTGGHST